MREPKKARKPKGSLRRILQNDLFALKWLFSISKFYVIFSIVNAVISQVVAMVEHTFLVAYIIDCIEQERPFTDVLLFLLPITGIIMFNQAFFGYFGARVIPKLVEKADREMRLTLYKKAAGMDIARYDDPEFYNDFVWAMQDAPGHVHGVLRTVSTLLSVVALILCTGTYMIVVDPIGILFVAVSVVITILLRVKQNKRTMTMNEELRPHARKRDYINRVFYLADYAKDLRMGNIDQPLCDEFFQASDRIEKITDKHTRSLFRLTVLDNLLNGYLIFDGLYLTYLLFQTLALHAFGYGAMVALYNVSSQLRNNTDWLSCLLPEFQEHSLYIEKMRCFLDTENTLPDKGKAALHAGGDLMLSNVDFTYPGAEEPTLRDITMHIPKGAKVALVGYNGAGKSTLVKLIMRLYDPSSGVICYGGRALSDYPLKHYRERISTLFQDHQLIAATVCENVTMQSGKPDNRRLIDCLQKAAFDDKLQMLPDGVNTPLTKEFAQNGVELSGGEAQKIAIARVLYSDADILILDEPSSALDPLAEYRLNRTIREMATDKTVIFISHRLSTTRMADTIYMLEAGRIIEHGSHTELMAKNGKYAEMFLLQAQKYR